jgi:hypothetical protein
MRLLAADFEKLIPTAADEAKRDVAMVIVNPASTDTPWLNRLKGACFSLVGLAFLGIGAMTYADTRDFVRHARRTEGTVVALNAGPAHPEIEYTDETGEKLTTPASGWISYRRGDRVGVLYLPNDPHHKSKVDDPGALWDVPTGFGGLGTLGLFLGVYLMLRKSGSRYVIAARE